MQALADSVPEMSIITDFNTDLRRPLEAARLARKAERYGHIAVWEDPVPKWDYSWSALLRTQIGIAIALHLGTLQDVVRAIKAEAMDYMNFGGGLFSFVKAANIAEAAGIPCWHGGGLELGIGGMSHAHACAAAKGCILPSHLVGPFLREDDLIVDPIVFEDGYAIVPKEPGLGVELDTEALEKYSVE
jgi:muconate cycloisomerase